MENIMKKRIDGFPNYWITTDGRVYSEYENEYLVLKTCDDGYMGVGLWLDDKQYQKRINVLVATAFIENSENKPTVNHIDENKKNNNVENLEWATRSEQIIHSINTGTIKPGGKGVKQYTMDREFIKTFKSAAEAARETGISRQNISAACAGKRESAGDFLWCFETEELREQKKRTYGRQDKVAQLDLETGEIIEIFDSIREATKAMGGKGINSHIGDVCSGKRYML